MRYLSAEAFRTALEERLQRVAADGDSPSLGRLRKLVVFERLLARLLIAAPDRWIVKGGVALDLRLGDRARTTNDLDLARRDSVEAATADLIAAQAVNLDDYFEFTIDRTELLGDADEGAAVRYRVKAELAGRRFEHVVVDIGFGDPFPADPDLLTGPDFLAVRLRRAIRETFEHRSSHALPTKLPPPPDGWTIPYRKIAREIEIDPDIAAGYRSAAEFIDPVIDGGVSDSARWDPRRSIWSVEETSPNMG
ncbi:MAG: nucleotidyl transferase AbiEii/AbiGii toxin family protein [Chloroflexia bacterium]|nr:nucleotidyl transferase AbiEii/AbiGii toxin family protein [Chloroflexia bacterium]